MGTKLELVWPGKYDRFALVRDEATGKPVQVPYESIQPRILIEQECYGDPNTDNLLIAGENLFALKTLTATGYEDQVRLIYLDPPYNTGNAFDHYDDGIEHSLWLSLMRDRLHLMWKLLSPIGSLWLQLDDNEAHYCRVLADEIFGRDCFIADITWQKRDGPPNDRKIGAIHDRILVYGKKRASAAKATDAELSFNLMPRTDKANANYQVFKEPSGPDPRGAFRKIDMTANAKGGRHVDHLVFPIRNPYTSEDVYPRKGTNWRHNPEEVARLQAAGRLYWGVTGTAKTPMRKLFTTEAKDGMTTPTIWPDVGFNQHASAELEQLFGDKAAFDTPKPEALMRRIIEIGSSPGDIVLDPFLGSGTTAAVAHKMGRRWIGIEAGRQVESLSLVRLKKIVDGTDQGGISQAADWKGGGGFHYCTLGKALIEQDAELGVWRLNYDNGKLIECICLQEGYKLCADGVRHGVKGRHFAHITEQFVTQEYLDVLASSLTEDEALTIYYLKAARKLRLPPNVVTKRIPQALVEGNQ